MLTATSRAFHALHRQVIGSCLYKNYTIVMEKMQGKMTKNKKISELFQYRFRLAIPLTNNPPTPLF
jgi:hypothetical protein